MKVLLVDDTLSVLLLTQAQIEEMGHKVITARDGKETIRLFEQEKPELVLLDVEMPYMNGYETARRIRSRCTEQETWIPIIFLSANRISDDDIVKGINSGGDDYLAKPLSPTVLEAKLQAMQRIHRLNQELRNKNKAVKQYHILAEQEAKLAKEVFEHITQLKQSNDSCVRSLHWPMSDFSGDLTLSAHQPSGNINVLFADFTGHGLAAALGALPVADAIYSMTEKNFKIEDVIQEINRKLFTLLPANRFCAAVGMEIDESKGVLKIWNGGLPEVLIISNKGEIRQRLASIHPPIGILTGNDDFCHCVSVSLSAGDRVYAYSDGLIEANNDQGEMFGQERLEDYLSGQEHPEQRLSGLKTQLKAFRGNAPQGDDISIIEVSLNDPRETQSKSL
jgi:DNA-binding response OmpR family regulator